MVWWVVAAVKDMYGDMGDECIEYQCQSIYVVLLEQMTAQSSQQNAFEQVLMFVGDLLRTESVQLFHHDVVVDNLSSTLMMTFEDSDYESDMNLIHEADRLVAVVE